MGEGYESVPDADSWQDLDEFLCEYVDGTMDPVVREVFEEYVRDNPDLAEHVQCLCDARDALIHSSCACRLKADFIDRLRRRLVVEQARAVSSALPDVVSQLGYLAAFTSALVVMTVAAMLLAEFAVERPEAELARSEAAVTERVEGIRFSSMFVAPSERVLPVGSFARMTPVMPRRMPIAPLWADAEWRQTGATVGQVAASW
jgi:hypothetical protein